MLAFVAYLRRSKDEDPTAMEFGVTMFPTDCSMGAAELAVAVEERNLDALFVPDHSHIPANRQSAFRIGDVLPADYYRNVDMFISLAAVAADHARRRLDRIVRVRDEVQGTRSR